MQHPHNIDKHYHAEVLSIELYNSIVWYITLATNLIIQVPHSLTKANSILFIDHKQCEAPLLKLCNRKKTSMTKKSAKKISSFLSHRNCSMILRYALR